MNSKVKYKNLSDNISVALTFYVFSLILEYLGSVLIVGQLPTIWVLGVLLIHTLSFIIFLLPTRVLRIVLSAILLALQSIVTIANEIIYRNTAELFTIDKLALFDAALGEVGVFTISMIRWELIFLFIFLFVLAIFVMVNIHRFVAVYQPSVRSFISILLLCLFSIFVLSYSVLMSIVADDSSYSILLSQYPVVSTYKYFGYYPMYLFNVTMGLDSLLAVSGVDVDEYIEYIREGSHTPTNAYTGVSADNDVILILAESLDICGIDEYFTPNLYSMVHNDPNSIYMSQYYSENKTNMSEGLSFLGTYSRAKPLSSVGNNLMCSVLDHVSLPSLLKQSDSSIATSYYHAIHSSFYIRDNTFDKLGFDNLVFAPDQKAEIDAYNISHGQYYEWEPLEFYSFVKDSNFIEYNIDSFIPDTGRLFTMYATMSTHGYYEEREANKADYAYLMSAENTSHREDMLSDLRNLGYHPDDVLSSFLYYKAGMMDLDRTIGIIKDRLVDTGRLDNTTILIYADHNAYYDNLSWVIRGIDDTTDCDIRAYNLPCIIYDKDLATQYRLEEGILDTTHSIDCDSFMSVADIYPTLCNILGLNYNTRLCYGVSVFDDAPHVFMTLKDSGYIFDNHFYYTDGRVYSVDGSTDSAYFVSLVRDIQYKFKVQEILYRNSRCMLQVFEPSV